jgi:hypothetical protein
VDAFDHLGADIAAPGHDDHSIHQRGQDRIPVPDHRRAIQQHEIEALREILEHGRDRRAGQGGVGRPRPCRHDAQPAEGAVAVR